MKKFTFRKKILIYNIIILTLCVCILFAFFCIVINNTQRRNKEQEAALLSEVVFDNIQNNINSLSNLSISVFLNNDFQQSLLQLSETGDLAVAQNIYRHISAMFSFESMVQEVWCFPFGDDNKINLDKAILSSSAYFLYENNIDAVKEMDFYNDYGKGNLFCIPLYLSDKKTVSDYFLLGRVIRSVLPDNYLTPIGVSFLVTYSPSFTNFSGNQMIEDTQFALYCRDILVYSSKNFGPGNADSPKYLKIASDFTKIDFSLISLYNKGFLFKDITMLIIYSALFSLVFVIVLIAFSFLMNYSISRNYNFLIKTFGGSGQIDKEIQYVGDSDIDKVIEQFNLTMKSISDLNKKITEEEIKNFKHSMDKSIYLLKYFNNQINAHFLFNVFSNIRALINLGYHKKACACINYLSRFLRYTLSSANMVKLGEEIKELDIYLSLFKLIYKDIHYDLRINDNCLDDAIPKFIIQPVVENCIMHGLTEKKGSIRIDAKKYNDTISIYVCDDGAGIPKEKLEKINSELMQNADFEIGKNLGLKNVQKRLKLLVSENCFIKLYSEEGKGTITRIKIDWRGKDA